MMLSQGVPDENTDNNLSPSLETIYDKMDVNMQVTGAYALEQYPITMNIENENGKLRMTARQAGVDSFLIPLSKNKFSTDDGLFTVEFIEENGEYTGANFMVQGMTLTSKKQ